MIHPMRHFSIRTSNGKAGGISLAVLLVLLPLFYFPPGVDFSAEQQSQPHASTLPADISPALGSLPGSSLLGIEKAVPNAPLADNHYLASLGSPFRSVLSAVSPAAWLLGDAPAPRAPPFLRA